MNDHQPEAFISLHAAVQLSMDFENEAIVSPAESERSHAFQREVLTVLRKHGFTAADLNRPTLGDSMYTLFQYLRGNPDVPWNVLTLLRDWMSRYNTTGYDFVAAWCEQQDYQAG